MISIRPLTSASAADYYLERDAGCEADYYLDPDEAAGRWIGAGAADVGLSGRLDERGEQAFKALLTGLHPGTGERLARPVLRADPAGRLPARPLLLAVDDAARRRGLRDATQLLGDGPLAETYGRLSRQSHRRPFVHQLEPRVATELAEAAGLDPVEVFRDADGTDVFTLALQRADERVDIRNAGYDVCISAPKSVSTLFALAGPAVASAVGKAHDAAVGTALRYLERESGHGLRGHQGDGQRAGHVKTDGFVGAAFGHRTSRANDPQLHTHVVVANLLHGVDGKWSAIDSWSLFRHATAASYVYHAALRGELTERIGVGWTGVERGIAEIAGMPPELMEAFSTRRSAIENELAALGRDDRAAAQRACLETRPPKQHVGESVLRNNWAATATDLGYDPAQVVRSVLRADAPAPVDRDRIAAELTSASGLTRRQTTVDHRDVVQAVCEAMPAGTRITLGYLDGLVDEVTSCDGVVRVAAKDDGPRFSTTELVETERRALRTADALRSSPTGAVGRLALREGMSAEQRQLVMNLVGDDGLAVVVGPAGSGKTAALAAAHRGWRAAGVPVVGATVAAIAARGLQRATGIPSVTLDRLLRDLDRVDARTQRPTGLAPGSVLVIDEAGMVDTRTLARLIDHAFISSARLVLVGDPEQLSEIEAGGLFRALSEQPGTLHLEGNVRQRNAWERHALAALRDGHVGEALADYFDAGRIHVSRSPTELRAALVANYIDTSAKVGSGDVVVLAGARREVQALNVAIRTELRKRGELGADSVRVNVGSTPRDFSVGDRVVVARNHHALGLLNGTRGTVTAIDRRHSSLRMLDADGVVHELHADLLGTGDVQHAYAMTVHKAQGITVDTALVSGSATLRKEAAYVALSRGRMSNHLYVTVDDLRAAAPEVVTANVFRSLDRLQQQLTSRSAHRLATSFERSHARDDIQHSRGMSR